MNAAKFQGYYRNQIKLKEDTKDFKNNYFFFG